jgi:hypothetical protein
MRKLIIALLAVFFLGSAALFMWARAVFTQDSVRDALAAQLSAALGQPVSVGSISAAIYPRVTVSLGTVAIGNPAGIQIASLDVGTDFRALLSRRIEHATARVHGARIQLPLIPLGTQDPSEPPGGMTAAPPVELVSIDEIVLSEVQVISAGRTLHGDIEVVPEADGAFTLRRATLAADDTSIDATGRITDLAGPTGELTLTAGQLNLDRLLVFFSEFAGGATAGGADSQAAPAASSARPNLTVAMTATRARLAGVSLDTLSAEARVTDQGIQLEPISFATFGGKYEGALALKTADGAESSFVVQGAAQNIDLPAVTRFAGTEADPITGRLAAQLELTGTGADVAAALRSMRGTARVVVQDGIVRNLGLVRAIVIATSMRGNAATLQGAGAAAGQEAARSRDEAFKTLSATLAIAGQTATTNDLQFDGTDVSMTAKGTIALDGSNVDVAGRVQLSEALTAQAGTDLVRVTQEQGRVTLPVTVTGTAEAPTVRIDVADLMKRAIRNRAEEELKKSIMKGLGGLLKKPPR